MGDNMNGMGGDDDFDDFGGFEAADPVDPDAGIGGNAGAQAGPNPWAVMYPPATPGGRSVQPDLLCGQNRFPQHLDNPLTVDVAGSAEASVQSRPNNIGQDGEVAGFDPDLDFNGADADAEFDLDNINMANDILDGSFRSTNSGQPGAGLDNHGLEQLPDISGLDLALGISNSINRPELVANAAGGIPANSNHLENAEVPLNRDIGVDEGDNTNQNNEEGASINVLNQRTGRGDPSEEASGAVAAPVNDGELERVQEEKETLKLRLDQLESTNTRLSEDLARAEELAQTAKQNYEGLQCEHQHQLEDLSQAGHQSLTVVVSEYKELLASTIQQQQLACEQRFVEKMKEEADRLRQILQAQKEEFDSLQAEERRKQEDMLSKAVEEMRQKEQEQFEKQLAEERTRSEELLNKQIQKEREVSAKEIEKVIEEERTRAQELLKQEQEKFHKELAKSFEDSKEQIKEAVKEQQVKSQEEISAMLTEERTRSRETLQQTSQTIRDDMHRHLEQQRQSDAAVQRRHLLSLDLFLETARQQLQLLMEGNKTEETNKNNTDSTEPS